MNSKLLLCLAYIDSSLVGTGKLDRAAIFSGTGDSQWATSPGFLVRHFIHRLKMVIMINLHILLTYRLEPRRFKAL